MLKLKQFISKHYEIINSLTQLFSIASDFGVVNNVSCKFGGIIDNIYFFYNYSFKNSYSYTFGLIFSAKSFSFSLKLPISPV